MNRKTSSSSMASKASKALTNNNTSKIQNHLRLVCFHSVLHQSKPEPLWRISHLAYCKAINTRMRQKVLQPVSSLSQMWNGKVFS